MHGQSFRAADSDHPTTSAHALRAVLDAGGAEQLLFADDTGRVALHWAAECCSREVVALLLDQGSVALQTSRADGRGWLPVSGRASCAQPTFAPPGCS